MKEIQETKEKVCSFFASDYHFEMIALPYIQRSLEENKKVLILTENDLSETIKILISRVNIDGNIKKQILNLDWTSNDWNKFNFLKDNLKEKNYVNILVKGKENYINNINENIKTWINSENNIDIINCYDIGDMNTKMNEIMENYNIILNTAGKKKI